MKLTQKQLISRLSRSKRASIITIFAQTVPELHLGCPWRVVKLAQVNGMVNWIYKNAVNRQREREGKPLEPVEFNGVRVGFQVARFIPEARHWGQRLKATPFIVHEGRYYLELKVERVIESRYLINGKPATDEQFQLLLPWLRRKPDGRRQMVDKPVILRDYALRNIVQVRFDGKVIDVNKPVWTLN